MKIIKKIMRYVQGTLYKFLVYYIVIGLSLSFSIKTFFHETLGLSLVVFENYLN